MATSESANDLAHKLELLHARLYNKIAELKWIQDAEKHKRDQLLPYGRRRDSLSTGRALTVPQQREKDHAAEDGGGGGDEENRSTIINFDKLLDIKMVFDSQQQVTDGNNKRGLCGFSEKEFKEIFAPIFCPTDDPEEVQLWYMGIDSDANGFVDWNKFSSYMMDTGGSVGPVASTTTEYGQVAIVSEAEPPSGHNITKIVHNTFNDVYYMASSDGSVREWDPKTLELNTTVHFPDGNRIIDLKYIHEKNQLIVAQDNQCIFLYDCGGMRTRQPHSLVRTYCVSPIVEASKLEGNKIMKTVQFDPLRMVLPQNYDPARHTSVRTRIDATLLDTKVACWCSPMNRSKEFVCTSCKRFNFTGSHQMMSVEPGRTLFPNLIHTSKDTYFLCGFERGYVALYQADMVIPPGSAAHVVNGWRPHTGWVTQIMCTTAHPQIQGFISSGTDALIQVMDVEKNESTLTMWDVKSPIDQVGGWIDDKREVSGFDFNPNLNMLVSRGNTRAVTVWTPTACCKIASLAEHKGTIVDVGFNDKLYQLISMSEDKVVKVWDVRTFKCIQTIADKEPRFPDDRLQAMMLDPRRGAIVSGSSTPMIWRDLDYQAKMETGVSWSPKYNGHLNPIIAVLCNKRTGHVVTADGTHIQVWIGKTGECVGKWSLGTRITAMAFDATGRRIFIGDDKGNLELRYYVTGRKLKVFSGCDTEVTATTHAPLYDLKGAISDYYAVATTMSQIIYVWQDVPIPSNNTRIVVAPRPFSVSINAHTNDHHHGGHVSALAPLHPNRIAVGTSSGDVLIYQLIALAPALYSTCMTAAMSNVVGTSSRFAGQEVVHQGRMRTQNLWKRTLKVASKEAKLGASQFTRFKSSAQAAMHKVTESMYYISPELIVSLHGDGDGVLWYYDLDRGKSGLEICACFPASYTVGSSVYACAVATEKGLLYVGDSEAIVTVFDIKDLLESRGRQRLDDYLCTGSNRSASGRVYHNRAGVRLHSTFRIPVGAITSLDVFHPYDLLAVGSDDCSVVLVDPRSGLIMGKFGYDSSPAKTWPTFEDKEGKLTWDPPAKVPTRGHPEIQGPEVEEQAITHKHRFAYVFPSHSDMSYPLNAEVVESPRTTLTSAGSSRAAPRAATAPLGETTPGGLMGDNTIGKLASVSELESGLFSAEDEELLRQLASDSTELFSTGADSPPRAQTANPSGTQQLDFMARRFPYMARKAKPKLASLAEPETDGFKVNGVPLEETVLRLKKQRARKSDLQTASGKSIAYSMLKTVDVKRLYPPKGCKSRK